MRTVHPPSMVAHLWANRSQDEARNPGKIFYFEQDTIFSYGSHFPIARHVEHKGKRAILRTTAHYSIATTGHCREVDSAIPDGVPVFNVPDLGNRWRGPDHVANLRSYVDQIEAHGKALANPRTKDTGWRKSQILNLNGERNQYAKMFGLRVKPSTGTIDEIVQRCQADRQRIEAAEKRRLAKIDREARARLAADIERWKAGESAYIAGSPDIYLRIKGDTLETSHGARVPVADAVRAFPIIARCRQNGSEWHRNGQMIQVGAFHFDAIQPTGDIKVGCHAIGWPEVERIARQLNLITD